MIIYIYSQDSWRAIQRKNELIQKFNQKYPNSITYTFDLEENDLENFLIFLENQSLFAQKKLGVVYNLFNLDDKKIILKVKSILNNKNIYLIIYEKNKPTKNWSFIKKQNDKKQEKTIIFEEFEILKGKNWNNFIFQEIQKRNIKLNSQIFNLLSKNYEGDSFRLINELEKLSLLNKKNIDYNDITDINIEISSEFWIILNQLKNKNLNLRLEAFEKILNIKEPLAKIFNILAYNWNEKIENLAQYDLAIKSGKIDYEEALLDAIL